MNVSFHLLPIMWWIHLLFHVIYFCFGISYTNLKQITSRDRPKSAPYPRLKNSKKTFKCQVFFYRSRKSKIFRNFFLKKLHTKKIGPTGALTSHNAEKLKGRTLWGFSTSILSQSMKNWRKIFLLFSGKNLTMPKKTEKRNTLGFSNIHSVAKHQKNAGATLWGKKIEEKKKCLVVPKKIERGDSLVSPGMVCYAEKQVKPFWSSSLGQMVQFDTIIFCRTFKNYFGQFVWIEKKRVTIIVAFHFMKRRLKNIGMTKCRTGLRAHAPDFVDVALENFIISS